MQLLFPAEFKVETFLKALADQWQQKNPLLHHTGLNIVFKLEEKLMLKFGRKEYDTTLLRA